MRFTKTCLLAGLLALAGGGSYQAAMAGSPFASGVVTPPTFSSPLSFTNPYFPFSEGGVKVFTGISDDEKITIVDLYSDDTRTFFLKGVEVPTRVLQETEFEGGVLVEISYNYFAQADDGTVYYFGEVVDIYEDGEVVSHDGSWLVGGPTDSEDPPESGNASVPAVFMPGKPRLGDTFKPEDLFPLVDETATIIGVNRRIIVPAGKFSRSIEVRETSRLSSGSETKWYAPGAGVVQGRQKGEWFKLIALHLPNSD